MEIPAKAAFGTRSRVLSLTNNLNAHTMKLMKTRTVALVAVALLLAVKAYPYSHDGHYLVGAIADQMLAGTPTAAKVKNLIGSVKLATAANFPDALKGWDPDVTTSSKPFKVTPN